MKTCQFVCTYKPIQHGAGPSKYRRGHAYVHDDGRIYEYHVPNGTRQEFRSWLVDAFQRGCSVVKVAGKYPNYWIEG